MKKILMMTVAGLLVYMSAATLLGYLLPTGTRRWILIGALWVVGIIAAAVVVWFLSRREKQAAAKEEAAASPAGAESGEIEALIREAEGKLTSARAGKIGTLPGIFLIGESGSTKTSTVVHSGLEPELLAGQVYQNSNVVPTPAVNLWLAGRIVIAEFSGKLLNDQAAWSRLQRRLQPSKGSVVGTGGQAPRAALICFDIETFTQSGSAEAAAAAARRLRQKLGEISEKLGINLPVYALFTRMDRVPFFLEYVRNLSVDDARQVLGASLPLSTVGRGTGYAEQETSRLNQAYDDLARSLCDARPELLSREHEGSLLPAVYEFPREFRKMRPAVVAFLTELCRPSQLTVGPFLRGFYFSGIRPVIVNEVAPERRPAQAQEQGGAEIGATRMMRVGLGFGNQQEPASSPQFVGTRKVPQWVFLSHLFERVLLQDKLAMGASGSSTKTSSLRRVLLILASVTCLIFAIGWTVSFFKNRGLESDVKEAAATAAGVPAGMGVASVESLRGLDQLRETLVVLSDHQRNGAPFFYRWGLYVGDDLYPKVYKLYFTRFKTVMFGQTQNALLDTLRGLPATPGPEYGPTYDTLKAYLITTSNHDKSTRSFLSPVLLSRWSANRNVDAPRLQLAQKQFDFYSDELKIANPYANDNDAAAIGKARQYLNQFAAFERVYRAMLGDAAKSGPAVNFNRQFPGSSEIVLDGYDVAAPFTKPGWGFMKTALQNPEKYFAGEPWVLGEQSSASFDRTKLAQQLSDRYHADFVKEWRAYLKAASVVKYASLQDAAKKLGLISGNTSPLLALFWLASQNTAVDAPEVANAFQPVQAVVPPSSVDRYIAPPNQGYMNAMVTLQASVEGVAAQPTGNDAAASATLTNATAAKVSARQVAQVFRIDPEAHIETQVQKLMEDPITNVEALLRNMGPAELNAKGKGLCTVFHSVWNKYPFNAAATPQATVADVNGLFHRPDGAFWRFYDENLQKLLPKQGSQYVPTTVSGVTLNPAFVAFFNQGAALSDFLYAGNTADPHIAYTLKPVPAEGIQTVGLRLDGQTFSYSGGDAAPKPFLWQGGGTHEAKATVKFGGGPDLTWSSNEGLWSIFQFFNKAETWKPAGNGASLEWVIRIGKDPVLLPGGKPLTVRFELDMGGGPQVFQKGYFPKLSCVPDVAKP